MIILDENKNIKKEGAKKRRIQDEYVHLDFSLKWNRLSWAYNKTKKSFSRISAESSKTNHI